MDKRKVKRFIGKSVAVLAVAFAILSIVSKRKKRDTVYDNEPEQKNPLEGKKVIFVEDENDKENADGIRGHLEAIGDCDHRPSFYERYIKRGIDIVLSFGGLVVLSPVFAVTALAIKIEDPGPVFFTQKRVGQNKKYFKLHKFRSMKMCTPHDVPTHMLDNPDQYITKVGKFIRAHSLDELPQIWDIFVGNMSVIGPRPGLWNQDLLTAERDKYGANDVKPGLTGWAQINGRDELEIPDKAKLDGEYVRKLGPIMDAKVFLGSLHVFGKDDSVVEGGTGEISKVGRHYTDGKSDEDLIGHIGFGEPVTVDTETKKKVLITGAGSYIGESFKKYAEEHYSALDIETLDMLDPDWKKKDFSEFDIVYHVAGLAHADVGNVDDATKAKYYAVNTDLAVEVCKKAKSEGVKEFVFMSSMIVYGDSAPYGKDKIIDEHTVPKAANFYGDSKFQADVAVRSFADDSFKVLVIRPPMIYGKGSKGNYPTLAKLAKKLPVFPDVDNKRSMLHIDNLCEFLCQIMLVSDIKENATVFMPQNAEWTKTSDMVKKIADVSGKKIRTLKIFRPAVFIGSKMPGKIGGLINKAFGNSCYEKELSNYEGIKYQTTSLSESVVGKVILIKSSIEYKELSFINLNIKEFFSMIKIIHKLFFTLISTIWIVIIYGIDQKWNFLNQSIFLTDVCLIAMPFILIAFWIIITKAGCSSDNVSNCENIDEVNNDFLANYLGYFFIGIGLDNCHTLVCIYIIVFIFTFASQTQFFNPMLLLIGYKYYYITTDKGTKIMIISRQTYRNAKELQTENLKRLSDTAFIEFGGTK